MESLLKQADTYEQTRDVRDVLGKRVLSDSGSVVGKVKQVRMNSNLEQLQGLLVGRGFLRSSLYISVEYINRLTSQAVFLNVEPCVLLRGRRVVSSDGKRFGTVKDVVRERETNKVEKYLVRRRWFWTYEVPVDSVKQAGKAVVLNKNYERAKSSFQKAA